MMVFHENNVLAVNINKQTENTQRKLVSTVHYNGDIKLVGHKPLTRADMSKFFCDIHGICQQHFLELFKILISSIFTYTAM